jgi:DNA (cytosine-5)-methyltransferase 1
MQLKAIDLFSGAGGLSLAASALDFSILAAIEIDFDACETYRKNITNKKNKPIVINEDILSKGSPSTLLKFANIKKGELDLLIGGPPCQGFSTHRINDSGVADPRNKLLFRYFEFVEHLRPKAFLIENVTGILWKRHSGYLKKLFQLAKKSGYTIYGPEILNARDFGVPQNRKRVFIVGLDNKIRSQNKEFSWPPKPVFGPTSETPWVTSSIAFEPPTKHEAEKIKSVIGQENFKLLKFGQKISINDPCANHMNHTENMLSRFRSTPINGSRKDSGHILECHKNHSGHNDVYGRIKLLELANTITTGCNNPSKGRFLHPWKHHGITLRHAARLQTFPDNYIFIGTQTSQARQIGNSVPPQLGIHVISPIKTFLKNKDVF